MAEFKNTLYYGDNRDVLPRHVASESVDLVYLDPPFNSNADYNVLFAEKDGTQSAAQIKAFTDTWQWDAEAARWFDAVMQGGHGRVADAMAGLRRLVGDSDMLAYLANMAPCLIELRRVLKPDGTLYLHCDDTASHYLKMLLDAVFSPLTFRNEIVWKRHNARSTTRRWPRLHDVLLVYSASSDWRFHPQRIPGDPAKMPHTLVTGPDGQKYQSFELTGPGVTQRGASGQPWRGFNPTALGRHWANSPSQMDEWDAAGLIHFPRSGSRGGFPRRRAEEPFVPDAREIVVGDVWTDIDRINQSAKERLGYPTQKPQALLERIVAASSDPGDVVLDPFCGCGTAIAAAQHLGRRWIGIDITHLAVGLIKHRLRDSFGLVEKKDYAVVGEPEDLAGATALFEDDPFQFQAWALGLVGARVDDSNKKGADHGIDGKLWTHDGRKDRPVVISVKGGKPGVAQVRDLRGVVERTDAAIGVMIELQEPTKPMREEAASAGYVEFLSPGGSTRHPRLQLLTVEQLLAGTQIDMPAYHRATSRGQTFKQAPKAKGRSDTKSRELGLE